MPVEIDGFAVLGAIAARREAFPAIAADIVKAAKAFVGKQIKDKGLTIDGLRAVAQAIDMEAFELISDGMSDAEIRALLTKVDKNNTEIKTAGLHEQRKHLSALATGAALPSEKKAAPAKATKAPAPAKPGVERSGNVKAMRAKRKV